MTSSSDTSGQTGKKAGCTQCRDAGPLGFDFTFAYQPIVDLSTRSIFGHEALVRGPNGESAYSVLSQVNDENRYVFDQACRVRAIEGAARLGIEEYLSINFLPNAVYRPEACIQTTLAAAREYNFPIRRIIFEVTEGEEVRDRPHLVNIFHEYRRFGFQTAIDDFGAGYTSFRNLQILAVDLLKIDGIFAQKIAQSRENQAFVRALCDIANALGIKTVAEWVDSPDDAALLRSFGVDYFQGFHFGKPTIMPPWR